MALEELSRIDADTSLGANRLVASLSALLKRVAMTAYSRERVASLSGEAWLQFLNQQVAGRGLAKEWGQCLKTAPYQTDGPAVSSEERRALIERVRQWIRHHRPEESQEG